MEMSRAERPFAARSPPVRLLVRRPVSASQARERQKPRHRLVFHPRSRLAAPQGGLRALAGPAKFRRRRKAKGIALESDAAHRTGRRNRSELGCYGCTLASMVCGAGGIRGLKIRRRALPIMAEGAWPVTEGRKILESARGAAVRA